MKGMQPVSVAPPRIYFCPICVMQIEWLENAVYVGDKLHHKACVAVGKPVEEKKPTYPCHCGGSHVRPQTSVQPERPKVLTLHPRSAIRMRGVRRAS